jgi:hypothetical protein
LRSFQQYQRDLPKEPKYRRLYVTFTANCFRMNLLLLKADIGRTNEVWVKLSTEANIAELTTFLKTQDPEDASNAKRLEQDLLQLVDRAKERR